MGPLKIASSTVEERRQYIKEKFHCISNCEACGLCQVFRGKDPEIVFADYIEGKREFAEVNADLR